MYFKFLSIASILCSASAINIRPQASKSYLWYVESWMQVSLNCFDQPPGLGEQRGQVPGRDMELPPLRQPRPGAGLQGGMVPAAAVPLAVPRGDPHARPLQLQRHHTGRQRVIVDLITLN